MNDKTMEVLKELGNKTEGQYVFPNLKKGKPFGSIRTGFETAVRKAGISNFRFHDLRPTAGTHMSLSNINLPTIQETLGHEDIRTTRRYAHPTQESMRKAMGELD